MFVISACSCSHEKTSDATCGEAAKCIDCGQYVGSPTNEHEWSEATCLVPKTCDLCGKTEGDISDEHEWIDATCYEPQTCGICQKKQGDKVPEHTWIPADCENPIRCQTCTDTDGEPLGHTWKDATYDEPQMCTTCLKTEGEPKIRPAFMATLKNQIPITIANYYTSGKLRDSVYLSDVSVSYEKGYSGTRIILYFTGQKTYDCDGPRHSDSCSVGIKVYDEDGYVVADSTYFSHSIMVGDKFKDDKCTIYEDLPDGIYTIELMSTM